MLAMASPPSTPPVMHLTRSCSNDRASNRPVPSKPRTHTCSRCGQKFRRAEHLKRHFRRHTLERPFRCRTCAKCFARKELHSRHQKRDHGCSASNLPSPDILPSLEQTDSLRTIRAPSPIHNPSQRAVNYSQVSDNQMNCLDLSQFETAPVTASSPWHGHAEYESVSSPAPHTRLPVANMLPPQRRLFEERMPEQQISEVLQAAQALVAASIQNNPPAPLFDRVPESTRYDRVCEAGTARMEGSFPYPSNDFASIPEDDFWLSSFDSLYAPGYPSPYPVFLAGFESSSTLVTGNAPADSSISRPTRSSHVTEKARERLQEAIQTKMGEYHGPTDSRGHVTLPATFILDRYWERFWALPNKNLPFLHESSTNCDEAPVALVLAILADGAMYCGDKHVGMAFLECSRRFVSQYMDAPNSTFNSIPLWVVNTLLINCVFGLPGGDAATIDLTVGGLQSLVALGDRIEPFSPVVGSMNSSAILSDDWKSFIEVESRKRYLLKLFYPIGNQLISQRTRLCILVMVRLWSTVYVDIQGIINNLSNLEMPCDEDLWTASSAADWNLLKLRANQPSPLRLQSAVESLFRGDVRQHTGLASMCQIVGLLTYTDELRSSSILSADELNELVVEAVVKWTESNGTSKECYGASISLPAAEYTRVSLKVDIKDAMRMFMNKDFTSMRKVLQEGKLKDAAVSGINALVSWAGTHKNQISMVPVPCAVVACESTSFSSAHTSTSTNEYGLAPVIRKAFQLSTTEDLSRPATLWRYLRRIVESGPLTAVLLSAMEAYAQFLLQENHVIETARRKPALRHAAP